MDSNSFCVQAMYLCINIIYTYEVNVINFCDKFNSVLYYNCVLYIVFNKTVLYISMLKHANAFLFLPKHNYKIALSLLSKWRCFILLS